jgi:hypothetical protein
MASIKRLKTENQSMGLNLVDSISKIDPSENNKLTPFLIKMVKSDKTVFKKLQDVLVEAIAYSIFGVNKVNQLNDFYEHLKNNRIENSDTLSYNSWDDLVSELNKAHLKTIDNQSTKEREVVYENDEWLAIKPLSYASSVLYGYNTRWCTAMKHEKEYFYNYSRNGILVYVLNKINGEKYAFYSINEEGEDTISVWSPTDVRIDSIQTPIPYEILNVIKDSLNTELHGVNKTKFSEKELEYYSGRFSNKIAAFDVGAMATDEEVAQPIRNITEEEMVGLEHPDEEFNTETVNAF